MELSRSAPARPTTTAEGAIGIERNRSVTPLAASTLIEVIVAPMPKTIVIAYIPGRRKSR
jgi:hypothetical protein